MAVTSTFCIEIFLSSTGEHKPSIQCTGGQFLIQNIFPYKEWSIGWAKSILLAPIIPTVNLYYVYIYIVYKSWYLKYLFRLFTIVEQPPISSCLNLKRNILVALGKIFEWFDRPFSMQYWTCRPGPSCIICLLLRRNKNSERVHDGKSAQVKLVSGVILASHFFSPSLSDLNWSSTHSSVPVGKFS